MKPPIVLLQERDFGQKINATFEFVVQHFKPLMKVLLYLAGPPALIGGFFMGAYQSNILGITQNIGQSGSEGRFDSVSSIYSMGISVVFLVVFLGIANLVSALAVNAYMLEYEEGNRQITPETVWKRMKGYIGSGIGYSIVAFVLMFLGIIFFIIPGIYIGVAFSLMYIIMMRENLGLGDTLRRCFTLINDKWWSTFGLLIIMGLIAGIVAYIFQIPSTVMMFLSVLKVDGGIGTVLNSITGVIATVGSTLTRSLVLVAIVFQYYNLLERRDGVGIRKAIENIGNTETPRADRREEEF
ncbi:MAG: hypothetical protein ACK4GN_10235 [Runella sp.]